MPRRFVPPPASLRSAVRCGCLTTHGTPCKNTAVKGSRYCAVHKGCKRKSDKKVSPKKGMKQPSTERVLRELKALKKDFPRSPKRELANIAKFEKDLKARRKSEVVKDLRKLNREATPGLQKLIQKEARKAGAKYSKTEVDKALKGLKNSDLAKIKKVFDAEMKKLEK